MPSITQLQYIVAVHRFSHFGEAAKFCNVSQPSLSIQIQKVEDEIGFLIFDRNKKPVLATEKGLKFISQAKAVLNEHDRLMQLSHMEANQIRGTLHLALIPTIIPYLLPHIAGIFTKKYQDVTLVVHEMKTDLMIEAMKLDHIDAGILATPLHEKGLVEKPLYYEPFYVYAHKSHPILDRPSVSTKELQHHETWLLKDGHCLRTQVASLCERGDATGPYPNMQFEGGSLETLRYLIQGGTGYTLMPSLFVEQLTAQERELHIRPIKPPTPMREVSVVYRRSQWKIDLIEVLINLIKDHIPTGVMAKPPKKSSIIPIDV